MTPQRFLKSVVIAMLALAVAGCGGGSKPAATPGASQPPAASPTAATTVATPPAPTPTATPAGAGPGQYPGTDIRALKVGGPGDIGSETVVYYAVLCYACGPEGTNLFRAYRDPVTRELRIDDLLSMGGRYAGKVRYAFAADFPRGEMTVAICLRGYCGGEFEASEDAENVVFRSTDGGITWDESGKLPPNTFFVSVSTAGAIAMTFTGTATRDGLFSQWRTWRYPSGEEVTPPAEAMRLVALNVPGIGLAWYHGESGKTYLPDGTLVSGPVAGNRSWLVGRTAMGSQFQAWEAQEAGRSTFYLGVFDAAGRLPRAWTWPLGFRVKQVGDAGIAFGNALLPEPWCGRAPGCEGQTFARMFPFEAVIIDLNQGTVHPMLELSRGLTGNSNPFLGAVVLGRFARVKGTGDCLNVREPPLASGRIVGCYADGVLLSTDGALTNGPGRLYLHVKTPDGREGWAAEEYLAW
jgi:hypothetical protein